MNAAPSQLERVKIAARLALGLIWLYEGLVPKILFLRADQVALVERSGLVWRSPQFTLQILGLAQAAMGFWLLTGLAERRASILASVWMCVLIVLVVINNPSLLVDPYGALVKDLSLLASAYAVWVLSGQKRSDQNP
ncbi:MAG TPA: DoxX-like family protein [Chthoniobacterales bacterium]